MRKKANIRDIAFVMITIFLVAIVFLTVKYTYTDFVGRAVNNTVINTSEASVKVFTQTKDMTDRLDYVLFALLMGFTMAILVVAWFAGGHPLFAFFYFIALVIIVAVSAVLSFVWGRVTDNAIFIDTVAELPLINFILDNLPVYIAIIGFIGMLVMYAKPMFYQAQ